MGKPSTIFPTEVADFDSIRTPCGTLYGVVGICSRMPVLKPEIIRELSVSGFMPHYKVRGFDEPLFKIDKVKDWAVENLIERVLGQPMLPPKIVVISEEFPKATAAP